MGMQISFGTVLLFPSYVYPEVDFLDHMIVLFYFLKKLCTDFYSGYTSLHFHRQCTSVPFSHPHQHLFIIFLIIPILRSDISLILSTFSCTVSHSYIISGKKCLFRSVFFIYSDCSFAVKLWVLYILEILTPSQTWKYFLLFHRLYFHFVDGFLCHVEDIWYSVIFEEFYGFVCYIHPSL